jgi:hypothetical protein
MAYQNAPAADIAKILDYAEILPILIASDEDSTADFRRHLEGLASQFSKGVGILQEFDRG